MRFLWGLRIALRTGAPIGSWRRTYRTTESRIVAVIGEPERPGAADVFLAQVAGHGLVDAIAELRR